MDIEDTGCRARLMIRDRDGKFPGLFDAILADAGIDIVLSGVRMPRMNSIMERWVLTCRRELLDRTLIWNQRHCSKPTTPRLGIFSRIFGCAQACAAVG
jgi:putative transposase